MELRIPPKLLKAALAGKQMKALRLFATAKLEGHRSEIKPLLARLKIHPKTGQRLIKSIVQAGWAGYDETYLFPRSWSRLKVNKRGGLYLMEQPKDLKRFEAQCFTKALKSIYRGRGNSRPEQGRTEPMDYPTRYLSSALGLSERRFERLKAAAQRYRYITVTQQYSIIGKAADLPAFRKNMKGMPVFKRGKHTVVPGLSRIKVNTF